MKLGTKRFSACEIALRIALAVIVAKWFPDIFSNDINTFFERARDIGIHHLPYSDFLWEYPPFGAIPLLLIPLTGGTQWLFFGLFAGLMIACEYLSLVLLRRARPEHAAQITKLWTVSVIPLSTIAWFRLDFAATLFATMALLGVGGSRGRVLAAFAGFGIKLWPLVFGAAMVLERKWREAMALGTVSIALILVWWAAFPEGFRTFLDYRAGDGFQVESIPGTLLLAAGRPHDLAFGAVTVSDAGFEWLQMLLQVLFIVVPLAAVAVAWKRTDRVNIVALLGAIVCSMLVFNRLLSPQFLVWLAPFVALLWPQARRISYVYVAAALLSVVIVALYTQFLAATSIPIAIAILRNVLLVWLTCEMFRVAFTGLGRPTNPEPKAQIGTHKT